MTNGKVLTVISKENGMKKTIKVLAGLTLALAVLILAGCGADKAADPGITDGTYVATFTTDNSMFHVSEANEDRGILTVKDGEMTIHVSLQSKKIVNLYPGLAEEAQKEGAELLEPTTDKVVYSDGYEDEVYGFDIPVPALDEEFDVALLGTKGKWYDHKVVVSDPVEGDDIQAVLSGSAGDSASDGASASTTDIADGEHTVEVTLEGGSGKSSKYDMMIVGGESFYPVNESGNSVFEIPVSSLDAPLDVIADTTAMSEPHEIEYTITFDASTIK